MLVTETFGHINLQRLPRSNSLAHVWLSACLLVHLLTFPTATTCCSCCEFKHKNIHRSVSINGDHGSHRESSSERKALPRTEAFWKRSRASCCKPNSSCCYHNCWQAANWLQIGCRAFVGSTELLCAQLPHAELKPALPLLPAATVAVHIHTAPHANTLSS